MCWVGQIFIFQAAFDLARLAEPVDSLVGFHSLKGMDNASWMQVTPAALLSPFRAPRVSGPESQKGLAWRLCPGSHVSWDLFNCPKLFLGSTSLKPELVRLFFLVAANERLSSFLTYVQAVTEILFFSFSPVFS